MGVGTIEYTFNTKSTVKAQATNAKLCAWQCNYYRRDALVSTTSGCEADHCLSERYEYRCRKYDCGLEGSGHGEIRRCSACLDEVAQGGTTRGKIYLLCRYHNWLKDYDYAPKYYMGTLEELKAMKSLTGHIVADISTEVQEATSLGALLIVINPLNIASSIKITQCITEVE